MGSKSSKAVIPDDGRPRGFYLVFGRPQIFFTGDPVRGPILFDVEQYYDEEEKLVEHTETFDLPVSVPRKQSFELTPHPTRKHTLSLKFEVVMVQAVRNVSVYAGVTIDYIPGTGLRISRSTHTPFVVLEKKRLAADSKAVFQTTEGINPKTISKVAYNEEDQLISAPLAIVVEVLCLDKDQSPEKATLSTLYTFLDLPEPEAKSGEDASGNEKRVCAKTLKQFLQLGIEVYELDDVFDIGGEEDPDEEDEDADLCVICMFNQKDTTILPCRHMCTCYECAGQLRIGTNKCPICRTEIERVITL